MKIIYDFSTRKFSIELSEFQVILKGLSEEVVHNLIRLILRPNCDSSNHWLTELKAFLVRPMTKYYKYKTDRQLGYLLNEVTAKEGKISKTVFYKYGLEEFINKVKSEYMYGNYRMISTDNVALGLINFIDSINTKSRSYTKEELYFNIDKWYKTITMDPSYWIDCFNIKYRDLKFK